jgi:ubiquinone/menaquinone biosynthesis C-methylase UbiE
MANILPNVIITGIDISEVYQTETKPTNCTFIKHNILEGLPFQDNHFDFVFQRFLMGGLTRNNWTFVLKEIEKVTKPGGWIELVEFSFTPENYGPNLKKSND